MFWYLNETDPSRLSCNKIKLPQPPALRQRRNNLPLRKRTWPIIAKPVPYKVYYNITFAFAFDEQNHHNRHHRYTLFVFIIIRLWRRWCDPGHQRPSVGWYSLRCCTWYNFLLQCTFSLCETHNFTIRAHYSHPNRCTLCLCGCRDEWDGGGGNKHNRKQFTL